MVSRSQTDWRNCAWVPVRVLETYHCLPPILARQLLMWEMNVWILIHITILLHIRVKGTIGTVTGENKFHNFTFSFDTKRSPVTVQEMKLLFPVNIPSSDLEVLYAKGLNMTEQATGKHAIVGWLPGASFQTNYKETLQL